MKHKINIQSGVNTTASRIHGRKGGGGGEIHDITSCMVTNQNRRRAGKQKGKF